MVKYVEKIEGAINGFGLSERQINDLKGMNVTLELSPSAYQELGEKVPKNDAPVVGVILDHKDGYYFVPWSLVKVMAKVGTRINFITHENCEQQMKNINGLILPDGNFNLPEEYYSDAKPDHNQEDQECEAYYQCFDSAFDNESIAILALGKGALFMQGYIGFALFRSASRDYFETPFNHADCEHDIEVKKGTRFWTLMKRQDVLKKVKSHHNQFLAPPRVQKEILGGDAMTVYASSRDGMPEAFGGMDGGMLGILWDCADMAAQGDENQLAIFKWFVKQMKLRY